MSLHRIRPDAGYVRAKDLPRGPNGFALCRWCGVEVSSKRRTFCGDGCIHEWKLRTQPPYVRLHVWCRDRGRCTACHRDVGTLPRWRGPWSLERYFAQSRYLIDGSGWQADHIVPVAEGGGECGLDGYQTLCTACHDAKTAAQARRRRDAKHRRGKMTG